MSSNSSTPLEIFDNLKIGFPMSPTNADIRTRAVEVRDILSSFDRDVFPSEFKPRLFEQLDRPFQTRPPVAQWTIQEDLSATLLQWGSYNDHAYELLTELQSRSILIRCFYEKLSRRTRSLFEDYDRLGEMSYAPAVRVEIQRIADGFRDIVSAVREDRRHRDLARNEIAHRLLEALIGICRRHTDVLPIAASPATPRRGTRRSAALTEGPLNLYEVLVKPLPEYENEDEEPFMLDVLETFPGSVFASLQSDHDNLVSLLDINKAPSSYKYRVGRLPSGTRSAAAQASGTQHHLRSASGRVVPTSTVGSPEPVTTTALPEVSVEGPTTARSSVEPQLTTRSTTGSKRAAGESSGSSKRRNKKTTRS